MKSNIKNFGVLLAAAAITTASLSAADKPATTTTPAAKPIPKIEDMLTDNVIAKGKGFEIKQSDLDEVVNGLKAGARASGQEITPAQLPNVTRELLDVLIQMRILNLRATDEQKAKGKEEATKHLEALKKQAPSEEALAMKLKAVGLTPETLKLRWTEEAITQEVLRSKVSVTDADVKKFYDDNPAQFERPEMVRASHILLATKDLTTGSEMTEDQKKAKRKQIEALLKRARDGEDFAKLAKEYSEDPGSKETGGEYKFPKGQMVPEFEAAAFSLKTNQISEVITTSYGYHIIKLSEKIPAQRESLDKVSADVKAYLEKKEIEKIQPQLYAQLKKEANVEIVDPQLKALEDAAAEEAAAVKSIAPPTNLKPAGN